mmetsp:Transcript_61162/g.162514  ORF Transcript_61162/g.162514 Transcript_61162/m.162514 type:complete len:106 (-) Transcript_61162:967-1284(-)
MRIGMMDQEMRQGWSSLQEHGGFQKQLALLVCERTSSTPTAMPVVLATSREQTACVATLAGSLEAVLGCQPCAEFANLTEAALTTLPQNMARPLGATVDEDPRDK